MSALNRVSKRVRSALTAAASVALPEVAEPAGAPPAATGASRSAPHSDHSSIGRSGVLNTKKSAAVRQGPVSDQFVRG